MSAQLPPVSGVQTAAISAGVCAFNAWQTVDFIADVHLQAGQPALFMAWQHYLLHTPADAVFILGDLFDAWVGDDAVSDGQTAGGVGFEAQCLHVLQAASQRAQICLMHGNRDFLVGQAFAQACGITLIDDPCVLTMEDQRFLLTHGDALCLADTRYQQFREQVRTQAWRDDFLARPLAVRRQMAADMRAQSKAHRAMCAHNAGDVFDADVDHAVVQQWLDAARANTLIHGHTHLPADHQMETQAGTQAGTQANTQTPRYRRVLGDWRDSATHPPVLRLCRPLDATMPRVCRLPS